MVIGLGGVGIRGDHRPALVPAATEQRGRSPVADRIDDLVQHPVAAHPETPLTHLVLRSEMNDVLARIHNVDYKAAGLGDFRPTRYVPLRKPVSSCPFPRC